MLKGLGNKKCFPFVCVVLGWILVLCYIVLCEHNTHIYTALMGTQTTAWIMLILLEISWKLSHQTRGTKCGKQARATQEKVTRKKELNKKQKREQQEVYKRN